MAPKKKGGKKANDDWEADLGEAADPIATAASENHEVPTSKEIEDGEPSGGGGLLAALKKNKKQKLKKGKAVEDFVEGEDAPTADGEGDSLNGVADLAAKAPQEATMDDDEFAAPVKKVKGGKNAQQGKAEEAADADGEELDADGKVMSKKEKEKAKKEREKQRKKEQVCQ